MSLKNFTKIDIGDDLRAALLHTYRRLVEPAQRCCVCGNPPEYGETHWAGVCHDCRRTCPHATVIPGYIIKANGGEQVQRVCIDCGAGPGGIGPGSVAPARRGGKYLDLLLKDHRDSRVCEHCGSLDGVELHHYAPSNTFDDAHQWATGYLCVPCHRQWHTAMDGYRWHKKRLPRRVEPPAPTFIDAATALPGQRVVHRAFGSGRVESVSVGKGIAVVKFDDHGRKRLLLRYAELSVSA